MLLKFGGDGERFGGMLGTVTMDEGGHVYFALLMHVHCCSSFGS